MDTATSLPATTPPTARRLGRRFALLWGAVGALLLVLACRFVLSGMTTFQSVSQRSCQGGFCVERVHAPDLLFLPGHREVHLGHDTPNSEQGRYYSVTDPFDEYSDVKIVWTDAGVSLSDQTATLTWSADLLTRLDD